MKKIRVLVIAVLIALMVMGVGYAKWSETITMNVGGTLGSFDMDTVDAYVINTNGRKVSDSEYASAEITGKDVSLVANKLIPGDCRRFSIIFKNVGDCPAVLDKVDVKRKSGDEVLNYILVSVDGGSWTRMDSAHSLALSKSIKPGDSTSIIVEVMLDQDAVNSTTEQPFSLTITPFFTQP